MKLQITSVQTSRLFLLILALLIPILSCSSKDKGEDTLCMQEIERIQVNHYSLSKTEEIILEELVGVGKEQNYGKSKAFDITLTETFPSGWKLLAPEDSILHVTSMIEGETTGKCHREDMDRESKLTFQLKNVSLLNSLDPGNCCGAADCDTSCGQGCAAMFTFQMKIPPEDFDISKYLEVSYSTGEIREIDGEKVVRVTCQSNNKGLKEAYYAFLVPTLLAGYEIKTLSYSEGLTEQQSRAYNLYYTQSEDSSMKIEIDISIKEVNPQAVGSLYFDSFVKVSGKVEDKLIFHSCESNFPGKINRTEKSEMVYSGDLIVKI